MSKVGFDFPQTPRQTVLAEAEEWYQRKLAEKLGKGYESIKRSNFGQYNMAVNYMTSVLEEAQAINKLAIFNIDHMAQLRFNGKDVVTLLDRVFPINISAMKIGQCKYTLLLTEKGTVIDDMILMKLDENDFIIVINAGHDITGKGIDHGQEIEFLSDADYILSFKKDGEEVSFSDISDKLAKIDIQGPLSYKLVSKLYGNDVLRNRNKPKKNMGYFTFNEFDFEGEHYIISRTGYTSRWGWELYVPVAVAEIQFKRILEETLDMGGLLVGLGGRDENRISAGNFGLPLNGSEYDQSHTPLNCPLFNAAFDMTKDNFVGKKSLDDEIEKGTNKKMAILISEGIVLGRGIYIDGKRSGTVTSSINSPNVSLSKRKFIGSKRKNVNAENGVCAIGLGWLYDNPFEVDKEGKDILSIDGESVRIKVEFYNEDNDGNPKGRPILGFISGDGVNPATAHRPLKNIENL